MRLVSVYSVNCCRNYSYYFFGDRSVIFLDILTDGIVNGSVQICGTGEPIVMMADRQTTGGYAKIASLINVDIPLSDISFENRPEGEVITERMTIRYADGSAFTVLDDHTVNLSLSSADWETQDQWMAFNRLVNADQITEIEIVTSEGSSVLLPIV